MIKINLRELYPDYYSCDYLVEVPEELAEQFRRWKAADEARRIKTLRYKAYYSLDIGDGIETEYALLIQSVAELYEIQEELQLLYKALSMLPDKQGGRVYVHFILGKSIKEIAQNEGVSKAAVSASIHRGLLRLKKYLADL